MKYWVAYDDRTLPEKIVAFHEEKKIVKDYIESVSNIVYHLGKCKSSELRKIKDVEDLYLIKHKDTYVQCKFYDYVDFMTEGEVGELRHTIDTLSKVLRIGEPNFSTRKAIVKSISFLKRLILEMEGTNPDYESIERMFKEYSEQKDALSSAEYLKMDPPDKFLQ